MRIGWCIVGVAALAAPALAQPTIDPDHRFSWQENVGWMNWAHSASGPSVIVSPTYLSGFIWCENVGWLSLGLGPPDGFHYTNATGPEHGVNVDPLSGELSGFAWGENIGWVNFGGGALASPASPARLDLAEQRLRGFAWAENVGWINLDDAMSYVGLGCSRIVCDLNRDGATDFADVFSLIEIVGGLSPCAAPCTCDLTRDGATDFSDVFLLIDVVGGLTTCP